MTLTRIADPESVARQGKLLQALEILIEKWEQSARSHFAEGRVKPAEKATQRAIALRLFAGATSLRLKAARRLTEQPTPGLADVLAKLPSDEPADSCPLADCPSWSATAPSVEHEVIERPEQGYRIHLFRRCRPERVGWWARLLGWLRWQR